MGPNRFTFGVLNDNHPVESGAPRLTFFILRGNQAQRQASAVAHFNQFDKQLKERDADPADIGGVFVTDVMFHKPGKWGVEISMPIGGKHRVMETVFTVARHSRTPAIGSPAPRSDNPTTAQMPATKLDSGRPPDDMHKLSIAGAIAQHKPLVVLFATAAYCQSRLCGPEIKVVKGLENRYRGRVNFVHIEVYKDANPAHGVAKAMVQWHLQTDPWVFVVDRHGMIAGKFEGPSPASEIDPVIRRVLKA